MWIFLKNTGTSVCFVKYYSTGTPFNRHSRDHLATILNVIEPFYSVCFLFSIILTNFDTL